MMQAAIIEWSAHTTTDIQPEKGEPSRPQSPVIDIEDSDSESEVVVTKKKKTTIYTISSDSD